MSRKSTLEYIQIMAGAAALAVAVGMLFDANGLVTGGVSGIGIILRTLSGKALGFEIPIWATNIILNAPLFIIGARVMGRRFLGRTLFATAFLSFSLFLIGFAPRIEVADKLLSAVFGGAIGGAGLGLVFKCAATTGGSDLAAGILHRRYRHVSMSKLLFIIDACVVTSGFFVFGAANAMYAIIAVFIQSKVIGAILEGLSFAKVVFIISDKHRDIAAELLAKLERGATSIAGKGMYTKNEKNIIFSAVSVKEVAALKEIVAGIDPDAFVIVSDAREVLGKGFSVAAA
jgi:uncharacterized membrane-anchored protein YitT (DUF2179 family)